MIQQQRGKKQVFLMVTSCNAVLPGRESSAAGAGAEACVRESSAAAAGAEACGSCGSSSYNYLGALLQLMIPCAGSPASACLSPARSSPAPTARCSAASPPRAPPLLLRSMSILLCFTFLLFTYKECFLQAVGLHMLSPPL